MSQINNFVGASGLTNFNGKGKADKQRSDSADQERQVPTSQIEVNP